MTHSGHVPPGTQITEETVSYVCSYRREKTTTTEAASASVAVMHRNVAHPYPLDSCKRHVPQKVRLGWRTPRLGALLLLAAGRITTLARVLLPAAAVVHVKQQRYNINDVNVKEHHHHHEVGAGTHAGLVARQAVAGRPLRPGRHGRNGRAPGRSGVLSVGALLLVGHCPGGLTEAIPPPLQSPSD